MSLDARALSERLACGLMSTPATYHEAAVLVPLVETASHEAEVIFEVRAATLATQPQEVCLPGGAIEPGETPRTAAVRETCEELLVAPEQIELVGALGQIPGPAALPIHAYVGIVHSYTRDFSSAEVERVFSVPITYFLEHDPAYREAELSVEAASDLPWERIPGGEHYAWQKRPVDMPFYLETEPLVWGTTARVMARFAQVMRAGTPSAASTPSSGTRAPVR